MISVHGNERTLSPRELARAIGVSESSVKRWIDAGRVPAQLTSGGHRRVELLPALRFLRESGRRVARPGSLGLSTRDERDLVDLEALADRVYELLMVGNGQETADLLLAALATRTTEPAALFDGPVRSAIARIGQLWDGRDAGIYAEHRATRTLLTVLDQIDSLFDPPADAPIAVGGSFEGDPSLLPTRMAATVLAAQGFVSIDLGADTPAAAFVDAAEQTDAKLVWISVGYAGETSRQSIAVMRLIDRLVERGLSPILGGREIDRLQLALPPEARVGRDMQELSTLARQVALELPR